jgi:sulfide:quinone oxidoreductase
MRFARPSWAIPVVALVRPRNVNWLKKGKWVHLANIAFEKYVIRKMTTVDSSLVHEKCVMKALGIAQLVP